MSSPDFTEIHHRGLNISSIRVFDQIRDLEIPITLRPRPAYSRGMKFLQLIYESFHSDLNRDFLIYDFKIILFFSSSSECSALG